MIIPKFGNISSVAIAAVVVFLTTTVTAIYPDDHWNYSKQLTPENFEETVQAEIDVGRTFFVRWIASPGWGWWKKQAAAWNGATRSFAGNDDVSFGDVNLREAKISGPPHNPGQGGWPTIRYFNKETGLDGASYVQKTDKAICDELGGMKFMNDFVMEAGHTSLCRISNEALCDDKEKAYILKMRAKTAADRSKEYNRLSQMKSGSMTIELRRWLMHRKGILQQFVEQDSESAEL